MGLFARLKKLFESDQLPAEDRDAYVQSHDLPSLVAKLHDNVTRNEVMRRQIMQAMSRLELSEAATVAAIKRGEVSGRGVKLAIQTVNRLRKQLESLDRKAGIVDQNLNLNTNLINKIDEMQALELRGVDQDQVDRVALEFDENMDRYRHSIVGSEAVIEDADSVLPDEQREELAALERELTGKVEHYAKSRKLSEAPPVVSQRAAPQKLPPAKEAPARDTPLKLAPLKEAPKPVPLTAKPVIEKPMAAKPAAPQPPKVDLAKQAEKVLADAKLLDTPVSDEEMKATMDEADRLLAELDALEAEMGQGKAKETE